MNTDPRASDMVGPVGPSPEEADLPSPDPEVPADLAVDADTLALFRQFVQQATSLLGNVRRAEEGSVPLQGRVDVVPQAETDRTLRSRHELIPRISKRGSTTLIGVWLLGRPGSWIPPDSTV